MGSKIRSPKWDSKRDRKNGIPKWDPKSDQGSNFRSHFEKRDRKNKIQNEIENWILDLILDLILGKYWIKNWIDFGDLKFDPKIEILDQKVDPFWDLILNPIFSIPFFKMKSKIGSLI